MLRAYLRPMIPLRRSYLSSTIVKSIEQATTLRPRLVLKIRGRWGNYSRNVGSALRDIVVERRRGFPTGTATREWFAERRGLWKTSVGGRAGGRPGTGPSDVVVCVVGDGSTGMNRRGRTRAPKGRRGFPSKGRRTGEVRDGGYWRVPGTCVPKVETWEGWCTAGWRISAHVGRVWHVSQ